MESSREQKTSQLEDLSKGLMFRDSSPRATAAGQSLPGAIKPRKTDDFTYKLVKYKYFVQSLLKDSK